jgi:hypothetical protein
MSRSKSSGNFQDMVNLSGTQQALSKSVMDGFRTGKTLGKLKDLRNVRNDSVIPSKTLGKLKDLQGEVELRSGTSFFR